MTAFADSSAIVKLYADEDGSEVVRSWPGPVLMAMVTSTEVAAALWRKHRMGELSAADARLLAEAAHHDVASFTATAELLPVVLTPAILDRAAAVVARHPLRAYDAVQLSTAIEVREVAPVQEFLAFDRALCSAAAAEGFDVPFEEWPVGP
ncbi:MAG: type II toxin-antitoxin system VapC family toxin [Actinomycetota bacterium]